MALRAREKDLRVLKEEVGRLEANNDALSRELDAMHHQAGFQPGGPAITPEYAAQTFTLKRITLGRGTGGYNEGKKPGDTHLQVIIEPRDQADDIIKVPGKAQVVALEVSPSGIKTPISSWDLSGDALQRNWKSGLLVNGYVLLLPWQQAPKTRQVRVVVRFQLSDGRVFEADRDVTVNPGSLVLPQPHIPDQQGWPTPNPAQPGWPATPAPNPAQPGWPAAPEGLPVPQEMKPPSPAPNSGVIQPSGWHAPSLNGAVQMMGPVPVHAGQSDAVPSEY